MKTLSCSGFRDTAARLGVATSASGVGPRLPRTRTLAVNSNAVFGAYVDGARSLFSGTNLFAVNIAPCGSAMTVDRIHGASKGGTITLPPSAAALSAMASASSTPKCHAPVR
jgi:hypothetical protein